MGGRQSKVKTDAPPPASPPDSDEGPPGGALKISQELLASLEGSAAQKQGKDPQQPERTFTLDELQAAYQKGVSDGTATLAQIRAAEADRRASTALAAEAALAAATKEKAAALRSDIYRVPQGAVHCTDAAAALRICLRRELDAGAKGETLRCAGSAGAYEKCARAALLKS